MVAFTVSPESPASRKVVLATTTHHEYILSTVAEAQSSLNQSLDMPYFQAQHPTPNNRISQAEQSSAIQKP